MQAKMWVGIVGGFFTLLVFCCGFMAAFTLNFMSLANTYTEEHVHNGRFMLWALKYLEAGEVDEAKSFLRAQVSTKVLIIDAVRLPTTSQREIELIESFYREVNAYFEPTGGFQETFQVMENGQWVTKPTPTTGILEEFKQTDAR